MAAIELSDYIDGVRQELERAIRRGQESSLRFLLEKVDLEIEIVTEAGGSTKTAGKFSFWVVGASLAADAKLGRKTSQTLRLSLIPKIHGESPFVSEESKVAER